MNANLLLVSVIVPCFNAARWIRETLASVRAQTGVSLQVIVVDDGSTDATAEIVAREFPRVELVQTTNQGASAARNRGLAAARGDVIQFLDADDVLLPRKIETQLGALREKNADVVYGDWQYLMPQREGTFRPAQTVARAMDAEPELALFTGFWSPLCVYLFTRAVVDKTGGFNPALPLLEDARFVFDCARHGARFEYVPGVVAHYRLHAAQISRRDPREFARERFGLAREVHQAWKQAGMTAPRRAALLQVYGNVARSAFELDRATFDAAYRELLALDPAYIPPGPRGLKFVSRWVGYPRAEQFALHYRRVKQFLHLATPGVQHPLPPVL